MLGCDNSFTRCIGDAKAYFQLYFDSGRIVVVTERQGIVLHFCVDQLQMQGVGTGVLDLLEFDLLFHCTRGFAVRAGSIQYH